MAPSRRPPRLLRALLARLLPRSERATLLADLDELYRLRVSRGRSRAALWYLRAALGFPPRLLLARLRSDVSHRRPPGTGQRESSVMIDSLAHDLRFAVRSLRRNPLFALVATATLGLGVGVNSTVFTVVNAILLRPLPVADPAGLVEIYSIDPEVEIPVSSSWLDYVDLRSSVSSLTDIAAHAGFVASLTESGRSELMYGEFASGNFFDLLGIRPRLGRLIGPEDDDAPGEGRVAVLGHSFWRARFGGAATILGRTLRLNGLELQIIGVAPASFNGLLHGFAADLWIPTSMGSLMDPIGIQSVDPRGGDHRLEQRANRWLQLKGRRAAGATVEQVRSEVAARVDDLAARYPETNAGWQSQVLAAESVRIHPAADSALTPAAALLLAVNALVLLIACANIAGMTLSRATARRQEVAVRMAMGAGRGRLIRQMVGESLVLGGLGGLVGLFLALWSARLLAIFQPPLPIALRLDVGVDGRVVAFTFVIALAAGLISGLAPALRSARADLAPALRDGSLGADRSPGRGRLGNALVVVQVAVTTVLVVGAILLARSAALAYRMDVGFRTDDVAVLSVDLDLHEYDEPAAEAFFESAVTGLEALPGVARVALASRMPLSLSLNSNGIYIEGHQAGPDDSGYPADTATVDRAYFDVLDVPLMRGRLFGPQDTPDSIRVAVINDVMARTYWPDGGAVGSRFRVGGLQGREVEIVGVVRDYRVRTVGEAPRPYVHYARSQAPGTFASIAVHAPGGAARLHEAIVAALRSLEPELVFIENTTMAGMVSTALFPVRAGAWTLGVLGTLAALLAGIGLYGVVALAVGRRTREIGLRLAVGASRSDVLRLVFRQGMALVMVGLATGMLLAAAVGGALANYLYGMSALDPLAFGSAVALLASITAVAHLIPARRAVRVDPVDALRE